jgi:hypothetical protein
VHALLAMDVGLESSFVFVVALSLPLGICVDLA